MVIKFLIQWLFKICTMPCKRATMDLKNYTEVYVATVLEDVWRRLSEKRLLVLLVTLSHKVLFIPCCHFHKWLDQIQCWLFWLVHYSHMIQMQHSNWIGPPMSNISFTVHSIIKCSNICIIFFSEYKTDFKYILTSCLLSILQYFDSSLLSYSVTSTFHCNFTPRTIMLQISVTAVGQEMGERYIL